MMLFTRPPIPAKHDISAKPVRVNGIHYGPTIIRIVWRSFDLSQRITLSRAAHETIKTLTCIKDL